MIKCAITRLPDYSNSKINMFRISPPFDRIIWFGRRKILLRARSLKKGKVWATRRFYS